MTMEKYGFDELKRMLDESGRDIQDEARKVTSKTLLEIKKEASRLISGHEHFPQLVRTFSYDVKAAGGLVTGEVGADIEKKTGGGTVREPGSLDFILEHGALNTAPIPHWRPAGERQIPLWEKFLGDAAEGTLDA